MRLSLKYFHELKYNMLFVVVDENLDNLYCLVVFYLIKRETNQLLKTLIKINQDEEDVQKALDEMSKENAKLLLFIYLVIQNCSNYLLTKVK